MGWLIVNCGEMFMKNSVWLFALSTMALLSFSCSKKNGPSPEDTSLIKGTDRGNFVGSNQDLVSDDGDDDLSPVGATITGLEDDDSLLPQDPFWSDSNNFANGDRPFEPIFFGFDQYNVNSEERGKLMEVVSFMQNNTSSRILIEGYCDWKGTPSYNKSLGDRRANSVKDYLVDLGLSPTRIDVISMGDELATPDADPTTAGLERKAQFLVLNDS